MFPSPPFLPPSPPSSALGRADSYQPPMYLPKQSGFHCQKTHPEILVCLYLVTSALIPAGSLPILYFQEEPENLDPKLTGLLLGQQYRAYKIFTNIYDEIVKIPFQNRPEAGLRFCFKGNIFSGALFVQVWLRLEFSLMCALPKAEDGELSYWQRQLSLSLNIIQGSL